MLFPSHLVEPDIVTIFKELEYKRESIRGFSIHVSSLDPFVSDAGLGWHDKNGILVHGLAEIVSHDLGHNSEDCNDEAVLSQDLMSLIGVIAPAID